MIAVALLADGLVGGFKKLVAREGILQEHRLSQNDFGPKGGF